MDVLDILYRIPFNVLIQHFLGLMGMPRRYWVFLHDQGLDLGNMISSIGALLMGVGILFSLLILFTQQ